MMPFSDWLILMTVDQLSHKYLWTDLTTYDNDQLSHNAFQPVDILGQTDQLSYNFNQIRRMRMTTDQLSHSAFHQIETYLWQLTNFLIVPFTNWLILMTTDQLSHNAFLNWLILTWQLNRFYMMMRRILTTSDDLTDDPRPRPWLCTRSEMWNPVSPEHSAQWRDDNEHNGYFVDVVQAEAGLTEWPNA
jgi:hypothetical protein